MVEGLVGISICRGCSDIVRGIESREVEGSGVFEVWVWVSFYFLFIVGFLRFCFIFSFIFVRVLVFFVNGRIGLSRFLNFF